MVGRTRRELQKIAALCHDGKRANKNLSRYELFSSIILSPGITTTVFADSSRLTCCANGTKKEPGLGSVGYWSSNEETDSGDSNESGETEEFNSV